MLLRGFQKPFRLNHAKNASIFVAAFGCEGFDVEKIDDNVYTSQFEAIAATISTNASSVISSFREFDVTDVGVPKKFNPPIQLFSKSVGAFKTDVANKVNGALNGALQYSKTKIAEQNITNISLSQFVVFANEYVQSESGEDYKDIDFAVDGENESKLIVNVKLSNTTDVSGIEFNLGDIAKINAAGSRNLSSSLEFQVAIDLDKNSDGNYLDSKQLSRGVTPEQVWGRLKPAFEGPLEGVMGGSAGSPTFSMLLA